MPSPREPFLTRLRAGRIVAWALLIVAVALGHVSVPWLVRAGLPQIEFNRGAPVAKPLVIRQVTQTPIQPPVERALLAVPKEGGDRPKPQPAAPPQTLKHRSVALQASITPDFVAAPEPHTAEDMKDEGEMLYAISGYFGGRPVGGSARFKLKLAPSEYLASLDVTGSHRFSTLFAWQLKTRGLIEDHAMRPENYDETLQFAGTGLSSHSVTFAPESHPDQTTAGTLIPRLDPLSALLRMSSDLHQRQASPGAPADTSEPYAIVVQLGRRSLHLNFERQGEELLSTRFGELQTEKYVTKYLNDFHDSPQISLWFAPAFRHAVVRIAIEQEGLAATRFELESEPTDFPAWR